jgi:MFS transporter, FLVCR family, feline leukemia virus subgroup C receptor-related protein
VGVVLGFFELPCLAITLTVLERSAGKEHAGSASGLYWTMGNAGVLGLTVLLELLKKATSWHVSINVVILLAVVLTVLVAWLREPAIVLHELENAGTISGDVVPAETD